MHPPTSLGRWLVPAPSPQQASTTPTNSASPGPFLFLCAGRLCAGRHGSLSGSCSPSGGLEDAHATAGSATQGTPRPARPGPARLHVPTPRIRGVQRRRPGARRRAPSIPAAGGPGSPHPRAGFRAPASRPPRLPHPTPARRPRGLRSRSHRSNSSLTEKTPAASGNTDSMCRARG